MAQSLRGSTGAVARSTALLVAFLLLLAGVDAHAAEFRCPSPEAFTFNLYIQAADSDEALRTVRERWNLKYLEKPTTCLLRSEYDEGYRKLFEPIIAKERARAANRSSTIGADCPGLPAPGNDYTRGTWLVLSAPSGCRQTMSSRDQLYVAGAAGQFAKRCNIQVVPEALQFLTLALEAAAGGLQEQVMGTIDRSTTSIKGGQAQLVAGQQFASLGQDQKVCASDVPQQWLQGLSRYLYDTAHDQFAGFVQSCVNAYRDTQPSSKCTCAAEVLRLSTPDIYRQSFSTGVLQDGYKVNVLGQSLLFCGLPAVTPAAPPESVAQGKRRFYCQQVGKPFGGRKAPNDEALVTSRCLADSDLSDQKRGEDKRAGDRTAALCEGLARTLDTFRQRAQTESAASRMLPVLERRYEQQCR